MLFYDTLYTRLLNPIDALFVRILMLDLTTQENGN